MTKVNDIYDNFLSKITDYTLLSANTTNEDIDDLLFAYLKSSIVRFYRCKNSLEIIMNETSEKTFTVELHPFEIEVLTSLMLVEYLKPQLLASELLRQSLSDKDFKIYSQANQLRELKALYKTMRTESGKMITEYTYFDLEDIKL